MTIQMRELLINLRNFCNELHNLDSKLNSEELIYLVFVLQNN